MASSNPNIPQVTAETRQLWNQGVAERLAKAMQQKSRKSTWGDRLEEAAKTGEAVVAQRLGAGGQHLGVKEGKVKKKKRKHKKEKDKDGKRRRSKSSSDESDAADAGKRKKKEKKANKKKKRKESSSSSSSEDE